MPARKKFGSTENESAVWGGGAAAMVDLGGGGVDAEGFCEIKRAVRLVSDSDKFVLKKRGAVKRIMRRGIGNCSCTTWENIDDSSFKPTAGGLLVHGARSYSVRVSHWLINIFHLHPDQKEGQGLAVFDRSNEGLKIIRKKNEFDGHA